MHIHFIFISILPLASTLYWFIISTTVLLILPPVAISLLYLHKLEYSQKKCVLSSLFERNPPTSKAHILALLIVDARLHFPCRGGGGQISDIVLERALERIILAS